MKTQPKTKFDNFKNRLLEQVPEFKIAKLTAKSFDKIKYELIEMQKEIAFYENEHEYYYKGNKCLSTTRLIKKYTEPFNPVNQAVKCSQNQNSKWYGMQPETIIQKWNNIMIKACDKGTAIHRIAELIANNLDAYISKHPYIEYQTMLYKFFSAKKLSVAGTEVLIYHPETLISGMVDLITYNDEGTITLWDYKTNSNIDIDNKYDKKMLGLCRDIDDTHYGKYSLQLSIYQYMLEQLGFEVDSCFIVHLTESGISIIQTKYFKRQTEDIFTARKQELKKIKI